MFHPSRPHGSPRPTSSCSFAGSGGFPRPLAPTSWGAGPEDDLRLDLVDGPTAYAAAATGNKPWMRHTSADERRRYNLAHMRLDDLGKWYRQDEAWWNTARDAGKKLYPRDNITAREYALAAARDQDLRCTNNNPCWQRFIDERRRLELGRLYHGVQLHLPFFFAASGKPERTKANPSAWRVLTPHGHYDEGHRFVDRNAPKGQPASAASSRYVDQGADLVCGSRNESCQAKFSHERWQLEYIRQVRARWRPSDFEGFYIDRNGNVSQEPDLLDGSKPAVEGKTLFIPGPTPQGTDLAEKPGVPASPRLNPKLLRFNPKLREQRLNGSQDPAPPSDDPAASDPALLEELAALEVLASAPASLPSADLPTLIRRALELATASGLLVSDQERAGAVAELLRAEMFYRVQEATPGTGAAGSTKQLQDRAAEILANIRTVLLLPDPELAALCQEVVDLLHQNNTLPQGILGGGPLGVAARDALRSALDTIRQEIAGRAISSANTEAPVMTDPAPPTDAATPDSKAPLTPDQQACADSMKALVEDAMKAGLTLDEARELLASEVEQHGPGLFRRLWNWVVQGLQSLFDDDDTSPPSASTPLLPAEAAAQAMSQTAGAAQTLPNASTDPLDDPASDPPPGAGSMGAGPDDEDPAPNFIERTQNRFLTLFKWGAAALVIILGGWFVAATIIVPRVVASAAPVFGDVVRQGIQSGTQAHGALIGSADKLLPLLTGGASSGASLLSSGASKALPLVLNA